MDRMVADFQPKLQVEHKNCQELKLQLAETTENLHGSKSRCEQVTF